MRRLKNIATIEKWLSRLLQQNTSFCQAFFFTEQIVGEGQGEETLMVINDGQPRR
jgi:hypothetical protein